MSASYLPSSAEELRLQEELARIALQQQGRMAVDLLKWRISDRPPPAPAIPAAAASSAAAPAAPVTAATATAAPNTTAAPATPAATAVHCVCCSDSFFLEEGEIS